MLGVREDDFVLGLDKCLLVSDFIVKLVTTAGEICETVKTDDHEGEEREAETNKMVCRGRHRLTEL